MWQIIESILRSELRHTQIIFQVFGIHLTKWFKESCDTIIGFSRSEVHRNDFRHKVNIHAIELGWLSFGLDSCGGWVGAGDESVVDVVVVVGSLSEWKDWIFVAVFVDVRTEPFPNWDWTRAVKACGWAGRVLWLVLAPLAGVKDRSSGQELKSAWHRLEWFKGETCANITVRLSVQVELEGAAWWEPGVGERPWKVIAGWPEVVAPCCWEGTKGLVSGWKGGNLLWCIVRYYNIVDSERNEAWLRKNNGELQL